MLLAGSFSGKLINVVNDKATVKLPQIHKGVSGFIVRHFEEEHATILSNAEVISYDKSTSVATLQLTPFKTLRQNSLPYGTWTPQAGDEAILGVAYNRGVLIAPTDDTYHAVTARIPSLEWVHPDLLAAFMSYRGHPTPIREDLEEFCTLNTIGLLYMYVQKSLFTMDCQSMQLLQITPVTLEREADDKLPFYYRFETIHANWFGEGSDRLETYDPYYFSYIARYNPKSALLANYVKKNPIPEKVKASGWFDNIEITFGGIEEEE